MAGRYLISFDDVLVYTSKIIYENIQRNWTKFSNFFWNPGFISTQQLYSRRLCYLNEWLIKNEFKEVTSKKYSSIQLYIIDLIKNICLSGDIYKGAEITPFAAILQNPMFLNNDDVKSIMIISNNVIKDQEISKLKFIEENFKHPKIKSAVINIDTKEDFIKNNDFDVYISSDVPSIRSIIENTKISEKQFILPQYGYNYPFPKELRLLIESSGGTVTYFNQFKENKG